MSNILLHRRERPTCPRASCRSTLSADRRARSWRNFAEQKNNRVGGALRDASCPLDAERAQSIG